MIQCYNCGKNSLLYFRVVSETCFESLERNTEKVFNSCLRLRNIFLSLQLSLSNKQFPFKLSNCMSFHTVYISRNAPLSPLPPPRTHTGSPQPQGAAQTQESSISRTPKHCKHLAYWTFQGSFTKQKHDHTPMIDSSDILL